jgi:dipeptidyl-peptidase-4
MHVWSIDGSGHETLVTHGAMDTAGIEGVDEKGGWLYFIASPDNATQRYLYRSPLEGSANPVRVTPVLNLFDNVPFPPR